MELVNCELGCPENVSSMSQEVFKCGDEGRALGKVVVKGVEVLFWKLN